MKTVLRAPVRGWAGPLDEAPDAVFSQRLLGDGVAIDPTGDGLYAPCAGEITSLAATCHAIGLRSDEGVEVLMHIGLETVALGGSGFTVLAAVGQRVETGDLLIRFEIDRVAEGAKSLLTPIVVTNSDAFRCVWRLEDQEVEVGDRLLELEAVWNVGDRAPASGQGAHRRHVRIGLLQGLHARPAAKVAALAKSVHAEVWLEARERRARATSPVALMGLGARAGDWATVWAEGADAQSAVAAIGAFLGEPEGAGAAKETSGSGKTANPSPLRAEDPPLESHGVFRGVTAAAGLAVGPTFQWRRWDPSVIRAAASAGVEAETHRLQAAIARVRAALNASAAGSGPGPEIFRAHLALLDDEDLQGRAQTLIAAGREAGHAFSRAIAAQSAVLRSASDPRIRERTADLLDLERRVLTALAGAEPPPLDLPGGSIVIAKDLLPSELLALEGRIAGVCTAGGGPTSHTAIIAAGMNLPLLAAAGAAVLGVRNGSSAILDASRGVLRVDPAAEELKAASAKTRARRAAHETAGGGGLFPGRLADGSPLPVFANLGGVDDAARAAEAGAEGCGLLRTEFLFMGRAAPPDEDEQVAAYHGVATALSGRPVVIRTFDIGADKPAAYLQWPHEDNPALGLRGVRTSLWRPDLLRVQLRAILRVASSAPCRIMAPMVSSADELRQVRAILETEAAGLGRAAPPLGVMIETPAAALTTEALAEEAAFFSIGTNDLTQYALAMDRGNPLVAAAVDALHPAVIRLMALACAGAHAKERPVSVCGALASDPLAAPLLVGLGARTLSAAPGAIEAVKAALARYSLEGCKALAEGALACSSAKAVRVLLADAAAEHDDWDSRR